MEWMGFLAFVMIIIYSSYPGKVKRLEAALKRVERKQREESSMSKLINDLINQECKIKTEEAFALVGETQILCHILDVDDEWIKIQYEDKKKNQITKLIRIEIIETIELKDQI